MWAVELTDSAEVVGLCGFFPHSGTSIELGYVIRADHWGKGLAPEVATAALDAAAETGYSVFATIRPTNDRSLDVARRIGLIQTDTIADDRGRLFVFTQSTR